MKLILLIIFFYFNNTFGNVYAQTIAVVNIQLLIDNNTLYNSTLAQIEIDQLEYLKNFEIKENQLKQKLKAIEDSKLILNEDEINLQIKEYNKELSNFRIRVEDFNRHYQNQILKIRESILEEIINLLEKYAITNNVDLILDSTTYLIASNTLDITEFINDELKKLNLELEYKNFDEN